jgi:SAM-dependent methyltransferase
MYVIPTPAKSFYQRYLADDSISPLGLEMLNMILQKQVKTVFEFGCGTGKNLRWLQSNGVDSFGIDVSLVNVFKAQALETKCGLGDESTLKFFGKVDCVFTCSVLDHIEDITEIIAEFKRISPLIYLMETNDQPGDYYYPHSYEYYGFTQLPYKWKSNGDGAVYHIWKNV